MRRKVIVLLHRQFDRLLKGTALASDHRPELMQAARRLRAHVPPIEPRSWRHLSGMTTSLTLLQTALERPSIHDRCPAAVAEGAAGGFAG